MSIKSYSYKTHKLNKLKYNEIKNYAIKVRENKNNISKFIYENYLQDLIYNTFDNKVFGQSIKSLRNQIAATSFQQSCRDVLTKYKININNVLNNYKLNSKNNTTLLISYMVRYFRNHEQFINIFNNLKKRNDFHNTILNQYNYFYSNNYDRLLNLVFKIKSKLFKSIKLIEYKSLTYTDINVLLDINMIEKSNIKLTNAIINFKIPNVNKFQLPVRHSNKYHGTLTDYKYSYNKATRQKQYTIQIQFDDLKNEIKINLVRDVDDVSININDINNVVGIDVNVKNNLFMTSDGISFDWNRKLVNKIVKNKKKLDNKKSERTKLGLSNDIYSKKMLKLQNKINRRIKYQQEFACSMLLNKYRNNTLVLENLERNLKKSYIQDNNLDIKYNDLFTILKLYSIKDVLIRMSSKYNSNVVLTNAFYTSQMCPKCGHISRDNRKTQETFCCVNCNHSENADLNAAINIKNRYIISEFRENLHKTDTQCVLIPRYKYKGKFKQELNKIIIDLKSKNVLI